MTDTATAPQPELSPQMQAESVAAWRCPVCLAPKRADEHRCGTCCAGRPLSTYPPAAPVTRENTAPSSPSPDPAMSPDEELSHDTNGQA